MKYLAQRDYQPIENHYPHLAHLFSEHAPSDAVGIDMAALGTLARIGGFYEPVTITTGRQQRIEGMTVAGHDSGAAVAARGLFRAAPLARSHLEDPKSLYDYAGKPRSYRSLAIEVDDSLVERVSSQGKIRDPSTWAREMDAAIKQGICSGAWRNLVRQPPYTLDGALFVGGVSLLASDWFGEAVDSILPDIQLELPINGYTIVYGANLIGRAIHHVVGRLVGRDMIWSAVPGWHFDRAIAVSALARARSLVASLR